MKRTVRGYTDDRLYFGGRTKLVVSFEDFCEKCGALKNTVNLLAWLQSLGMLNVTQCVEFLKKQEDKK